MAWQHITRNISSDEILTVYNRSTAFEPAIRQQKTTNVKQHKHNKTLLYMILWNNKIENKRFIVCFFFFFSLIHFLKAYTSII